jgi:phosphate-selective porin OprO/OprP
MKMKCGSVVLGAILLIGAGSAPVWAEDTKPSVEDRLLEVLRQKNVITEAEYADLKNLADEMRREEVTDKASLEREIERYVEEAQAKSAAGDTKMTNFQTGWDENKGFYAKSADGNFSIALGGLLQVRYSYVDLDDEDSGGTLDPQLGALARPDAQDSSTLELNRARFRVSGNVFDPSIKYFMQIETAGESVTLRDYFIDYTRFDPFNIKMGQYKVPFGRQELTSAGKLQLMDRSRASNFFTPGRNGGAGVMAYGALGGDNDDLFEYYAGVFNGEGQNVNANDGPGMMGAARVAFNPLGKFGYDEVDFDRSEDLKASIGGGLVYDADDGLGVAAVDGDDVDTTTWGIDAAGKWMGFSAVAEYFMSNFDPDAGDDFDASGWYAQAGWLIADTDFEIAARYGMVTDEDGFLGGEDNDFDEWTIGANYYFHKHNAKVQADWTRYTFDPDAGDKTEDDVFRIQVQLMF